MTVNQHMPDVEYELRNPWIISIDGSQDNMKTTAIIFISKVLALVGWNIGEIWGGLSGCGTLLMSILYRLDVAPS